MIQTGVWEYSPNNRKKTHHIPTLFLIPTYFTPFSSCVEVWHRLHLLPHKTVLTEFNLKKSIGFRQSSLMRKYVTNLYKDTVQFSNPVLHIPTQRKPVYTLLLPNGSIAQYDKHQLSLTEGAQQLSSSRDI